jgi:large subunit ribosomal protein L15
MQLHQLKPKFKPKKKKRIGRGGKRGTYSGRGIKGQKARAGAKIRPDLRDFIKRIPKKRGYRFKSIKLKPQIVNLKDLEKHFQEGEVVSPETLLKKGLIAKVKSRVPEVKILGEGKLTKKLEIKNCKISKKVKHELAK